CFNDYSTSFPEEWIVGTYMLSCAVGHDSTICIHIHPLGMAVGQPYRWSRGRSADNSFYAIFIKLVYDIYKKANIYLILFGLHLRPSKLTHPHYIDTHFFHIADVFFYGLFIP